MSLATTAARGALVTISSQGGAVALQFCSVIVLARLLTPTEFGLVAMVTAIIGVAVLLSDFGLSTAAIQTPTLSGDEQTNLFWANFGLGVLTAGAAALATPLIVAVYHQPALQLLVPPLAAVFAMAGFDTQFQARLARDLRFTALAASNLISLFVALALAVTLAAIGLGVWALVIQQLTAVGIRGAIDAYNSHWWPSLPRPRTSIRRFFRFGGSVIGAQGISYIVKNIDNFAIGAVWGAAPLGLYSRAYQLMMAPLNKISAPMANVALPVLARVQSDDVVFLRYLRKSQLVAGYLTTGIFALSIGLAKPIVLVLFGRAWIGVAPIFALLAVGGIFRAVAQVAYWAYLSRGVPGAQLRQRMVTGPISIALILAGLPWGAVGVAAGHTVGYFITWVVSLWHVGRVARVDTRGLFVDEARQILVVALPCALLAYAASLVPTAPEAQIAIGMVAAVLYVGGISLVVTTIREDLRTLMTFVTRLIRRTPETAPASASAPA